MVVLVNSQTVSYLQGLVLGKDGSTGISFLLGIIPVGSIAFKREVKLSFLHLCLLQAEKISIKLGKYVSETFVAAGTQPVYVPGYKFNHTSYFFKSNK